jgi:hypothetical protein
MNTAITTKPDQSDSRFAELIRIGNQTALGAGHPYIPGYRQLAGTV